MNNTDCPFVSIIIPVKNEERYIETCLKQLTTQSYPENRFEILVIDGMSSDHTRNIVKNFPSGNIPIHLLENHRGQRAPALNIGIKEAYGDVIIRIDARTVVGPEYIRDCVNTLVITDADNVGGIQKPIAKDLKQQAIGLSLSHPFGVGDAQFRLGKKSGFVDTVYLGCFRKEVFQKVGFFDEKAEIISEDADMNYRIRKAGGRIYLNKDIVAYYYPRETLKDFWKLYFRYGSARAGNFIKHRMLAWRQIVPPVFFGILVVLTVFSLVNLLLFKILIAAAALYIAVDIIASLLLAISEKKIKLFPLLLITFPTMHFAWGLGFWKRILYKGASGKYWDG